MKLFLIGFMGCGKTTIGKMLAAEYGFEFIDLDTAIELLHEKSIAEIFATEGEERFREIEHETLKTMISNDNFILSTGGGAPCFHDNMSIMNNNGITVYLKLTPQELTDRLYSLPEESRMKRPLIAGKSPIELYNFITKTLEKREPIYSLAKVTTHAYTMTPEELAHRIKNALDCVNVH